MESDKSLDEWFLKEIVRVDLVRQRYVMTAVQCQRLLKGRGGGDRKFVSDPPTKAINTAIKAMKPESELKSNTQRITAPSTTSENGAHVFTHHLLIHICIFGRLN